ncbi:MAG: hypothetical protein IMY72_13055, partial [Bacteroidetes bacterium]|nr:hypothetical protein [Bacteroidota bacterium]
MSGKTVLTIGILAHVDAGKTSITESMLHHSGHMRQLTVITYSSSNSKTHDDYFFDIP